MHDDDFDRTLSQRLRAYESRIPDADAPELGVARHRSPWIALIGVGAAGMVAAGLLAIVLMNGPSNEVGDASPTASASPSADATASPTASAAPTTQASASAVPSATPEPEPTAAAVDLAWTVTASFGAEGGATVATEVASHPGGLVAVGTAFEHPLPNLGPTPPRGGRIWTSSDGRTWEDTTPDGTFADAVLRHVYSAADGTLIVLGTRTSDFIDAGTSTHLAWESTDAVAWRDTQTGFPEGSSVASLEHGPVGYLALVFAPGATHGSELWFSPDGRAWERVRSLIDGEVHIGAGPEGFVVSGRQGAYGGEQHAFTIASADGRAWFEASNPPPNASGVMPLGSDWLILDHEIGRPNAVTWHSANGLDWSPHGELSLQTAEVEGAECAEFPAAPQAAGPWLVSGTILSYPCSEGSSAVYGSHWISTDGRSWTMLPFDPGTPGTQGSGSLVNDAVMLDGRLILVGESNFMATFWIGEAP